MGEELEALVMIAALIVVSVMPTSFFLSGRGLQGCSLRAWSSCTRHLHQMSRGQKEHPSTRCHAVTRSAIFLYRIKFITGSLFSQKSYQKNIRRSGIQQNDVRLQVSANQIPRNLVSTHLRQSTVISWTISSDGNIANQARVS